MPMVWNAEADAKLMAGLIKLCNVKTSGKITAQLAKAMGPDCTARAIENRFTFIHKKGAELNFDGDDGDEQPKPNRARAAKVATGASGGGRKKAAGKGRAVATQSPLPGKDKDSDDDYGLFGSRAGLGLTPPPSNSKKRGYGEMSGKVKREPMEDGILVGEDIGEGLRSTPVVVDEYDENDAVLQV